MTLTTLSRIAPGQTFRLVGSADWHVAATGATKRWIGTWAVSTGRSEVQGPARAAVEVRS